MPRLNICFFCVLLFYACSSDSAKLKDENQILQNEVIVLEKKVDSLENALDSAKLQTARQKKSAEKAMELYILEKQNNSKRNE